MHGGRLLSFSRWVLVLRFDARRFAAASPLHVAHAHGPRPRCRADTPQSWAPATQVTPENQRIMTPVADNAPASVDLAKKPSLDSPRCGPGRLCQPHLLSIFIAFLAVVGMGGGGAAALVFKALLPAATALPPPPSTAATLRQNLEAACIHGSSGRVIVELTAASVTRHHPRSLKGSVRAFVNEFNTANKAARTSDILAPSFIPQVVLRGFVALVSDPILARLAHHEAVKTVEADCLFKLAQPHVASSSVRQWVRLLRDPRTAFTPMFTPPN